jgi:hypothetical protein
MKLDISKTKCKFFLRQNIYLSTSLNSVNRPLSIPILMKSREYIWILSFISIIILTVYVNNVFKFLGFFVGWD